MTIFSSLSAQELKRVVKGTIGDQCPSSIAKDMFDLLEPYLIQAYRDSESGTVNAHEEGG